MQIYLFLFLHMAKTPQSQHYETYILVLSGTHHVFSLLNSYIREEGKK